jgi:nucleoside 2-deoxyribosyltransferase
MANAKKHICQQYGLEGVFPLDNAIDLQNLSPPAQGVAISRSNEELMRSCDAVIANMTPFRGPSMDVGTAFEMGYMRALGKLAVGYTNVKSNFFSRVAAFIRQFFKQPIRKTEPQRYEDPLGMAVENLNLTDNLMLDGAVMHSGGRIIRESVPRQGQYTALTGFEKAVRLAAEKLTKPTG